MNVSILLLVCLVLPKYIAATVYTVIAGDINDLISTLGLVADYDTVLIPPGDYVFELINYPNPYPNGHLCAAMPAWPNPNPYYYYPDPNPNPNPNPGNLLIRGTGSSRSDVKLVAALFRNCERNIVIENLSLYTVPTGPTDYAVTPVAVDGFTGTILRNTYIQIPVIASTQNLLYGGRFRALYISSGRIAVMYSTIETNPPVPSMGTNSGLTYGNGGGISVIKSTFAGFQRGILLYSGCNLPRPFCIVDPNVDELNRKYKIYGSDLSQNTIPIDDQPTVTSLLSPNTPKGQNYFVKTFIDILRYHSYNDAPYVPIKIRVKKVKKAGETTIYRVPSAYPEPPPGFISASEPQYYQFDSTAKFGNKSNVFFKQSEIQNKFPGFSGILTCMYHDGTTWSTVSHVVYGGWYKIIFPKKNMKGLIAIFKN